ncbi:MAG: hypothetical protein Q4E54_07405 [Lachnospiraceae bacterium]|nr:hypothetical protein [Lachnospiraceae bacterium]
MKFFRKLEFKFGTRAIPNLMLYVCVIYSIGWVIQLMMPNFYFEYLSLNATAILKGQVWRLITWLAYPPSTSMIFGLIMIYVYWTVGHTLEMLWGSFQFNVFIIMGVILNIIGAFVLYLIYGPIVGYYYPITPINFTLSILLAFMASFPDAQFLLFFIIPVKAKYLGIFYLAMTVMNFIPNNIGTRAEIILSLINFVAFFLITGKADSILNKIKNKRNRNGLT